jgi:hypothetical protein
LDSITDKSTTNLHTLNVNMSQAQRPSLDDPNVWVPYRYEPNLGAAVAFAILFAIATIWHSVTMVRKRAWFFIPFVIGGICT